MLAEAFVVCQNFCPPEGFRPENLRSLLEGAEDAHWADSSTPASRLLVPFVACGDLSGWDADMSYDLPSEGYVTLPPVAPPTAPPYKTAIAKAKLARGGH